MSKCWKIPVLAEAHEPEWQQVRLGAGSVLHWQSEGSDWYGHGAGRARVEWRDAPYEFVATLTLDEGIHTGRSAKYTSWTCVTDHRLPPDGTLVGANFPMFVAELVKVVRSGRCEAGGVLAGRFKVVKRGRNFGIEFVGPAT